MCRTAFGSDVSRTWKQFFARKLARLAVGICRLNHGGFLRTEFSQSIRPVGKVWPRVKSGDADVGDLKPLQFRCGHGRLLWRIQTFYTEEPDTVSWLDSIEDSDVLWDVGANVGMYSVYAAKVRGCKTFAFEPESQNYATLVENIALNGLSRKCLPVCIAVSGQSGFGRLGVHDVTKGGAWNDFRTADRSPRDSDVVEQSVFGVTLDDLVKTHGFTQPTHLKIDVDGLEPEIIKGAGQLLSQEFLRSVLVEVDMDQETHREIPNIMKKHGLYPHSETPTGQACHPGYISTVNMIFQR